MNLSTCCRRELGHGVLYGARGGHGQVQVRRSEALPWTVVGLCLVFGGRGVSVCKKCATGLPFFFITMSVKSGKFMIVDVSGRLSMRDFRKASDVYSFGVLLWGLVTGKSAHASLCLSNQIHP